MNSFNALSIVHGVAESTTSSFRMFRRREAPIRIPIHEFCIDGTPLLALIDPEMAVDPQRHMPLFDMDHPEQSLKQCEQLLGGHLPADRNGRTWLLYCQCGDPGCGGYSARIAFTDKTVIWSDFGWDDIFGSATESAAVGMKFVFERCEYEELLRAFVAQLSGDSAHRR